MHIVILAGEPSGDMHAARLAEALKKIVPETRFSGTGGPAMEKAGVNLVLRLPQLNFMGFVEIIRHLGRIRKNFRVVKKHLLAVRPDALILVDYPGFNLRMARWAHKKGLRVVYYIAPQVWAWKEDRVKILKHHCHKVLCILPFEEVYFKEKGVPAVYVGHPLTENLPAPAREVERTGLSLFPGSRRFEIKNHLPVMLQAAARLGEKEVLVARAPGMDDDVYQAATPPASLRIRYTSADEALDRARYAFVKSGTSSLQAALWQVPHVVCYRGHRLSYLIARKLVKVPYVSLVNLIAGRQVVQELLQNDFTVERLTDEGKALKADASHRQTMLEGFRQVLSALGNERASENAAGHIAELLKS